VSEYQYYEFQAIDRPLEAAAQAALRRISSRGEITAYSFTNTYQWGDFKGDPRRLMQDWFDLFVYWANWGTRTLMLRLPRRYLDPKTVKPYAVPDMVEAWTFGDFTLVSFERNPEDSTEPLVEDDHGVAAPFAGLRADLLRGDRRLLYLGWLLGVQDGHVDEAAAEPPRPAGLDSLSAALEAFTDFFALDPDLVAAAAEGGPGIAPPVAEPSTAELSAFIEALPEKEKTDLLRRAVLESDPHVRLDVCRLWARDRGLASSSPAAVGQPPRTAGDLLKGSRRHAEARRLQQAKKEAAARARREAQARRELAERLDKLATRTEAAWQKADALAATRRPDDYDRALDLLKDLALLADRDGTRAEFDRRLGALRNRHLRKPSFLARLDAAGLTGKQAA
jgi:hypothetical protein